MGETNTLAVQSGYYEVAASETLSLDSEPISVQANQLYGAQAWVVGFEGSPGCALLALIFLDGGGKEVHREIALVDDFSGRVKEYRVRSALPPGAVRAVVVYRINTELPPGARTADCKLWVGESSLSETRPSLLPGLWDFAWDDFVGWTEKVSFRREGLKAYLEVAGWVAPRALGARVVRAVLRIDDAPLGPVVTAERPDVAAVANPSFLLSSWHGLFEAPELDPGYHVVLLEVSTGHHSEVPIWAREVLSVREDGSVVAIDADYSDGLPVPPPELIHLVTGTENVGLFLKTGAMAALDIRRSLATIQRDLEDFQRILDFGCGCGRAARHLRSLPGKIHGSDYNPRLTQWCQQNLPFAEFGTNALWPGLEYGDETFDLAYALSVFTHMTVPQQEAWLRELSRVLRPGGVLLITTLGSRFRRGLFGQDKERFELGEIVVVRPEALGSNDCMAYHPPGVIPRLLPPSLRLVSFLTEGAIGTPSQDVSLLMKLPAAQQEYAAETPTEERMP